MATIAFELCPSNDCNKLLFVDKTGRQPGSVSGYDDDAVLSSYSGTLNIYDAAGILLIKDIPVDPSTDGIAQEIDMDAYPAIPDGIYSVRYLVRDNQTQMAIGEAVFYFAIHCKFSCDMMDATNKLMKGGCCSDGCAQKLIRARDYRNLAFIIANGGNVKKASEMFVAAQDLLTNVLCNCK